MYACIMYVLCSVCLVPGVFKFYYSNVCVIFVYKVKFAYRISSINTASLISTTVQYYLSANNIELSVNFNSSAPSTNTACPKIFTHDGVSAMSITP